MNSTPENEGRIDTSPSGGKADLRRIRCLLVDPSNFTLPYDQELILALKKLGVEVDWIGRKVRTDDPRLGGKGDPTPFYYRISERIRSRLPGRLFLPLKAAEHFLDSIRLFLKVRRGNYDVVHLQWTPVPVLDRPLIRLMSRYVPVVLTVHDSKSFHGSASHGGQHVGWEGVLRAVSGLIVHVESSAEALLEMGVGSHQVMVIPHPPFSPPTEDELRLSRTGSPPEALGFDPLKINFLLFGRLARYKGIDTLLEALKTLGEESRARIRVVLAGKPTFDKDEFLNSLQEMGLDDVVSVVPRFITEEELDAALSYSQVVLFPYLDIDASGAFMKAIGFGPAVIASKTGGFGELLEHNQSAFLVDPGDETSLAEALVTLSEDEALREKLASASSRIFRELYRWDSAAELTLDFYARICDHRERG